MSKQQLVEELHKLARKRFNRRKVITKGIDDLWQIDLVEMIPYSSVNRGYRYLLTVIDTFSKFAWAIPVKTKTAIEVTKAMENIFKSSKRIPKNLQSDLGKEFYNKHFENLMKKYKINHYSTYSTLKASIVERFNRTLKAIMWKEFSLSGSYKWITHIQELIEKYNSTKHRTIGMSPHDVNLSNEKLLLKKVYSNMKTFPIPKYKIGDSVRISKHKHAFEKGYTPNWTTEIFKIISIKNSNPVMYYLEDYRGNPIKGGFYEKEILKTKYPHNYLIEKILKRRRNKIFVKWLGFSNSHNSWIDNTQIL